MYGFAEVRGGRGKSESGMLKKDRWMGTFGKHRIQLDSGSLAVKGNFRPIFKQTFIINLPGADFIKLSLLVYYSFNFEKTWLILWLSVIS